MKSQKVTFQKSQNLLAENLHEKAAYSEHSRAIHSISEVGYVTAVLAYCPYRAPFPGSDFLYRRIIRFKNKRPGKRAVSVIFEK